MVNLLEILRLRTHQANGEDNPVALLIVGLGNPGREYRENRHNIGFMVIDYICKDMNIRLGRLQSKSLVGSGIHHGQKLVFAKPQTFMNLSGQSVSGLMRFYKLNPSQLLVIHDDLDLPLGTLRMRPSGGSAGQKGLGSIIEQLGTQDFPRLRMGIGRPSGRMDAADYVLQDFNQDELDILKFVFLRAIGAVNIFVEGGIEQAMNQYNGSLDA
jgi:PTH1 family peptidyl-tRNA hydrolase